MTNKLIVVDLITTVNLSICVADYTQVIRIRLFAA